MVDVFVKVPWDDKTATERVEVYGNVSVQLRAMQEDGTHLAIVVDVSGSMDSGNKMGFVRAGLHTLLDSLHDEDTITVATSDRGLIERLPAGVTVLGARTFRDRVAW